MSSRPTWMVILLLSLGVNLGLLIALGQRSWHEARDGRGRGERPTPDRHHDGGPSEDPDGHAERLGDRLGIAPEHREEFLTRQRSFFRTARELRDRREEERRALHQALTAPVPDPVEIEERLAAVARASDEMERTLAEHVLEIRGLLDDPTEERYLKFLERLTSFGPERKDRRHRRRRPR